MITGNGCYVDDRNSESLKAFAQALSLFAKKIGRLRIKEAQYA